jgi:hypothetical protein
MTFGVVRFVLGNATDLLPSEGLTIDGAKSQGHGKTARPCAGMACYSRVDRYVGSCKGVHVRERGSFTINTNSKPTKALRPVVFVHPPCTNRERDFYLALMAPSLVSLTSQPKSGNLPC